MGKSGCSWDPNPKTPTGVCPDWKCVSKIPGGGINPPGAEIASSSSSSSSNGKLVGGISLIALSLVILMYLWYYLRKHV